MQPNGPTFSGRADGERGLIHKDRDARPGRRNGWLYLAVLADRTISWPSLIPDSNQKLFVLTMPASDDPILAAESAVQLRAIRDPVTRSLRSATHAKVWWRMFACEHGDFQSLEAIDEEFQHAIAALRPARRVIDA